MSIAEFTKKVKAGQIDIVKHTENILKQVKKINLEYHYLNTISESLALEQAERLNANPKGMLAGVPITIKDSICVKGVESTAGSKILKGYKPVFNATAVQRCIDEGAIIIGKSAQDEFGFGAFSTNIGIGMKTPLNPFDKERVCGGSSGGAAGIVKKAAENSLNIMSMGESTGGSIVNPGSFCGVFALCPTYGRVSRYGIMDYANSLDKLGPMADSMQEIASMLKAMSGFDEKESTSLDEPVDDYSAYLKKDVKGMKIGVIKESLAEGTDEAVQKKVWDGIKLLESNGAKYEEVSLATAIKYGIPTYYMIATSEASTNLAKYCGMRYGMHEKLDGNFNEYFTRIRSDNLGKEAKRRIMLGTFARMAGYRDAYYLKAMRSRTLIIQEYKKVFKKFDFLASPTVPMLPPRFDETDKMTPLQNYMADVLTVGPNLAGLPHLNVPVGSEKKDGKDLPVGMMLTADHLKEGVLIQAGKEFDR